MKRLYYNVYDEVDFILWKYGEDFAIAGAIIAVMYMLA